MSSLFSSGKKHDTPQNVHRLSDTKELRRLAELEKNGGESMTAQKRYFTNPGDSDEWIASMERENHYMARQIVQLEEDKKRLVNELHGVPKRQENVVNMTEYEQVTKSLKTLEEKSAKLEKQLLTAKEFIDRLSETASNDEQLIRQNETLQNQLKEATAKAEEEKAKQTRLNEEISSLEAALAKLKSENTSKIDIDEYDQLAQKNRAFEKEIEELTTANNRLTVQALDFEEKQKKVDYDANEKQEMINRLNRSIETLQLELTDEKAKHIIDPKTSAEYVALLEENIRLRSKDPKETAAYLELLTEKNKYEQKYKSYNPKASKEYLELLVITERQRAQIAETIANQEMVRITQEEIADILSEAQRKARRIIERSEEKAQEMIDEAEHKVNRMQNSLNHYNDDLKAMVNNSVEVFRKLSTQADELDEELTI